MKEALILCSGGLDSVVTAHKVATSKKYYKKTILFFDYGQNNLRNELKSSRQCAHHVKANFLIVKLVFPYSNSSSLLGGSKQNRKISRKQLADTRKESKKWYVPARNLIFLSYALSTAERMTLESGRRVDIFVGFKCEGTDPYPDSTQDFVDSLNRVSEKGIYSRPKIYAPLIKLDKEEIIQLGIRLGVELEHTFSCYSGERKHCGKCLACMLRKEGFYWAGVSDPTNYL